MLPSGSKRSLGTLGGPLPTRLRKVGATVGQYAPNIPGHTRAAMVGTEGCNIERWSQSLNPTSVGIEGCNPPS